MKMTPAYKKLFFFFPGLKKEFEEQRALLEKLKADNILLRKQKAETEALAEAKTTFLATMSHEIRTQLNAISGMTYFLGEEGPRPDQLKHINILKFASESLRTLVDDILDLNKISAGMIVFENLDFNVTELQNVVVESVRQNALTNSVELITKIDQRVPEYVIGDPVRLGQVLTNLMSNAVKFTKNGKVDFNVSWVGETEDSVLLKFVVADNGIGIEKSKIKEIFEAFTQASMETTRKFGGTGLGLTISQKLLELQKTKLEVESQLGIGSVFSFDMEFKKSEKLRKMNRDFPPQSGHNPLAGIRLLIAEDNRINQMVARKFLNKWGINFDLAEDGVAALEKIRKFEYDIILMDLNMPLMDGYSVTQKVRTMTGKSIRELPIIALTASATAEERNKYIDAGMNDFVPKPFNPEQLYEAIARHVIKENAIG